jgi:UDP-N-acetylmuramoyl-L-alanyl-D-glutamate--2,6-diaminopimelate ligase
MHALPTLVPELENVNIQVSGIRDDSRLVQRGDLFLAVSGQRYSAQKMLEDIQDSGAAAALYDADESLQHHKLGKVPLFAVHNLNAKRGHIASRFFGEPSRDMFMVGVTGTNGKTSCTQYIAAAMGKQCGVIGTMGWGFPPDLQEPGLTTPDALKLQALFASLSKQGASAVCVEASSHGLVQDRLAGTQFDVAVFTNLTRDHLDYHGSLEAYQAAKKQLFTDFPIQVAVVNKDDPFGEAIARDLAAGVRLLEFSLRDASADVFCEQLTFDERGISASVVTPWGKVTLQSELIGDFNASNLLAVICVLGAKGFAASEISSKVSSLVNVKGRMDRIDLAGGAVAVIDYAHTPDALENALRALRVHCRGQLFCVMGCGGDRDVGKRPLMGEVASRLSDQVVVTDDNPRTEDPGEIIANILAGVRHDNVVAISDRASAIRFALNQASEGDIVLIAGKGHEPYQETQGVREPFSDHEQVMNFKVSGSNIGRWIVLGFGLTGQSVARFGQTLGHQVTVVEDNAPQVVEQFTARFGPVTQDSGLALQIDSTDTVMLSPGVPASHPLVQQARQVDAVVSNDIQQFAYENQKPLCMITGSNGKSTVTSFIGQLFSGAGETCALGGNIGIPALDLLSSDAAVVALEVSSYQLEVATDCQPKVAVLLNLSPDHLDRYDSVTDYYRTKTNIFNGAEVAVYGRDISFVLNIQSSTRVVTFGLDAPDDGHFGVSDIDGVRTLMFGQQPLVAVSSLPFQGQQDLLNIQAAMAAAAAMGLQLESIVSALAGLQRLEHRFEVLADTGVHLVVNDSKATNPASTEAAIKSLSDETRPIDLILGGQAKDADFAPLKPLIGKNVQRCFIYGVDRETINLQIGGQGILQETLDDCLAELALDAGSPRVVLFSPGCASLDQFRNFAARGEYFKAQIRRLIP